MRIWDLVAPEYRAALERNSGELLELEAVLLARRRFTLPPPPAAQRTLSQR